LGLQDLAQTDLQETGPGSRGHANLRGHLRRERQGYWYTVSVIDADGIEGPQAEPFAATPSLRPGPRSRYRTGGRDEGSHDHLTFIEINLDFRLGPHYIINANSTLPYAEAQVALRSPEAPGI
jgi:hypothetical protein